MSHKLHDIMQYIQSVDDDDHDHNHGEDDNDDDVVVDVALLIFSI